MVANHQSKNYLSMLILKGKRRKMPPRIKIFILLFISYIVLQDDQACAFSKDLHSPWTHIQDVVSQDSVSLVFYDAANLDILGQLPNVENFSRLPEEAQYNVRPPIWSLSKHSSGISIRFSTNSSTINLRWTLHNNRNTPTQTAIASKGFDLYAFVNNKWQFVGVATPTGNIENEVTIITGMEEISREYLLNLPLYDGVHSLQIGIDKQAIIGKPAKNIIDTSNPIVFYGTSITQGASASRPGLTYSALLQRYFNKEVINLGFSGNGRFEKEIAKYIMTANPSVIILDCTPNSGSITIQKNLPETIDYIRSISDKTPIILVESIIRDYAYFKKDDKDVFGTFSFINEQNRALKKVFEDKVKVYENIYYLNSHNLIGQDHEATIDGTHFNDIGHFRAFEFFREQIFK